MTIKHALRLEGNEFYKSRCLFSLAFFQFLFSGNKELMNQKTTLICAWNVYLPIKIALHLTHDPLKLI